MRFSSLLLIGVLSAPVVAGAAEWPARLRTGRLMGIGLNYSTFAPERLDAFSRMRCRMMLGGVGWVAGWGSPAENAADAYRAHGFGTIAYSTPHTLFGDKYFDERDPRESVPRSREWLAVGGDGTPMRPWGTEQQRYLACVNHPGWRAYNRGVVQWLARIKLEGVFWDDAFPHACYCSHCHSAVRKHLAGRYSPAELAAMGVTETELPLPAAPRMYDMSECKTQLDREWAMFAEWSLEDFMAELKRAARSVNPRFLFAINSSQPGVTSCMLLSQAVMDVWVYEEGPHTMAPQNNNSLRYLQGFARAMRQPVQMIANGDGWGHEKATPVQFAASIAEGVACGGEFLLHLGHAGNDDDEVWRTNPANAEAVTQYRRFFDERQDRLQGLKTAAPVAVFDSNKSAMYVRSYYPRLRQQVEPLLYSGVPFTVLNAETSANLLDRFDLVVAANAQVLSDGEVKALARYRKSGGRLVCIGAAGTLGERWRERKEGSLPSDSEAMPAREALAQAAAKGPLLEAPPDARVQLHAWEKGGVRVLHVLNYTLDASGQEIRPVAGLRLRLPKGMAARSILWETPEGHSRELQTRPAAGGIKIELPELSVYGMLTLRLGRR